MDYDKGPQLTAKSLREFLACIPDDTKIVVGIGVELAPAHYLNNRDGNLVIHPDCYMVNAVENNIKTMISFNKK